MNTNFNEIKTEILRRAKEAKACIGQYGRAYKSETLSDLCQVIKGNFSWACSHKVITVDLLEQYREDFAANNIYVNVDIKSGYLLCNNATVEAWDNATVVAWGNATVVAYDNATVVAYDNATVVAYGNATVEAWDNATVVAWGNATVVAWGNAYCTSLSTIECKLSGNAIYRVRDTNTIYYASDNMKFVKQ